MSWFDLAVGVVVLGTIISGFDRGFIRTAAGFLASLVAIVCAFWFYGELGLWLHGYISSRPAANAVGFLLMFCGITILGCIVEWLAVKFLQVAHLTWLDRLLGAVFGAVQGLVIATVAVVLVMAFAPSPLPKAVVGSRCVPYLENAAHVVANAAPAEVHEGYQRARHDLEKVLPQLTKKS